MTISVRRRRRRRREKERHTDIVVVDDDDNRVSKETKFRFIEECEHVWTTNS